MEYAFSIHDEKKAEIISREHEILEKASQLNKLKSDSQNRKRMANEVCFFSCPVVV